MLRNQSETSTTARDALEMGLYLSLVLMSLIVAFERSLNDDGELLMIWASSIGLSLAHILAFRIAHVYQHGSPLSEGWASVRAMFVAAFGVAVLASIPYLFGGAGFRASTVATVLLFAVIAFGAFLAGRQRGWSGLRNFGFVAVVLLVSGTVVIIKIILSY